MWEYPLWVLSGYFIVHPHSPPLSYSSPLSYQAPVGRGATPLAISPLCTLSIPLRANVATTGCVDGAQ